MKKLIAIFMICIMMFSVTCFASNIDLSNMNYEELLELKNEVNMALWNSNEWKEVEVPVGLYRGGDEIPAGTYFISYSSHGWTSVCVGKNYENGDIIYPRTFSEVIDEENGDCKVIIEEGDYIEIKSYPALFKPYVTNFSFN